MKDCPFDVILGGASLAPVQQGDIRDIRYETFQRLHREIRNRKSLGHPVYLVADPARRYVGVVDTVTREYLCIGLRDLLQSFIPEGEAYSEPLYEEEPPSVEEIQDLISTREGLISLFEADPDHYFDGDPLVQWEEDTVGLIGGDLENLWEVPQGEPVEDIPIDRPKVDVAALVSRLTMRKV